MTELYLILHKVRGEPAFDVAIKLEPHADDPPNDVFWIIPTSGHRAYPWWTIPMSQVSESIDPIVGIYGCMKEPPIETNPNWTRLPDHYTCNDTPKSKPAPVSRPKTLDDFLV